MPSGPQLISFVLRFVCDAPAQALSPVEALREIRQPVSRWRGVVRHVQSDAEQHFARWEDAVSFMGQYVALQKDASRE